MQCSLGTAEVGSGATVRRASAYVCACGRKWFCLCGGVEDNECGDDECKYGDEGLCPHCGVQCIVDTGAQRSMVTLACLERLGLSDEVRQSDVQLSWQGGGAIRTCGEISLWVLVPTQPTPAKVRIVAAVIEDAWHRDGVDADFILGYDVWARLISYSDDLVLMPTAPLNTNHRAECAVELMHRGDSEGGLRCVSAVLQMDGAHANILVDDGHVAEQRASVTSAVMKALRGGDGSFDAVLVQANEGAIAGSNNSAAGVGCCVGGVAEGGVAESGVCDKMIVDKIIASCCEKESNLDLFVCLDDLLAQVSGGDDEVSAEDLRSFQKLHRSIVVSPALTDDVEEFNALSPSDKKRWDDMLVGLEREGLFDSKLGATVQLPTNLHMGVSPKPGVRGPRSVPRHYPNVLECAVREALQEYLDAGVIVEVTNDMRHEHDAWCSELLPVQKKNGTWRFVIDLAAVNAALKDPPRAYLPSLRDIQSRLWGMTVFSVLDCTNFYWAFMLAEDCQRFFTFHFAGRYYRPTRVPQGAKHSVEYTTRVLDRVLANCSDQYVAMVDDLLVYGRNSNEAMEAVRTVMTTAGRAGLRFRRSKCVFGVNMITFMQRRFGADGVQASAKHLRAILEATPPTDKGELRSFLGQVQYLRPHVPGMSTLLTPLNQLLKKNVRWDWTKAQEAAFIALKAVLTLRPVTAPPQFGPDEDGNPPGPFLLYADASEWAIGAVLTQRQRGREVVIEYLSKQLTGSQLNWTIEEKELWALLVAMATFKYYTYAGEIIAHTDHANLVYLQNKTSHTKPSRRVSRWQFMLSSVPMKLIHTPGEKNPSDALSRLKLQSSKVRGSVDWNDVEMVVRGALQLVRGGRDGCGDRDVLAGEDEHLHKVLSTLKRVHFHRLAAKSAKTAAETKVKDARGAAGAKSHRVNVGAELSAGGVCVCARGDGCDGELCAQMVGATTSDKQEPRVPVLAMPHLTQVILAQVKTPEFGDMLVKLAPQHDGTRAGRIDGAVFRLENLRFCNVRCVCLFARVLGDGDLPFVVWVPPVYRLTFLRLAHGISHRGRRRTKEALKRMGYWRGFAADVDAFCRQCDACVRGKGAKPPPIPVRSWAAPSVPFAELVVDLVGPLPPSSPRVGMAPCRYIFTAVCRFTRWPFAVPIPTHTAKVCAEVLVHEILPITGMPVRIMSDRGSEFTGRLWKALCAVMRVDSILSTAYSPQQQGAVERMHRTLGGSLVSALLGNGLKKDQWARVLPLVLAELRQTKNRITGHSPHELVMAHKPRTLMSHLDYDDQAGRLSPDELPAAANEEAKVGAALAAADASADGPGSVRAPAPTTATPEQKRLVEEQLLLQQRMTAARQAAAEIIQQRQQREYAAINKDRQLVNFEIGDTVYMTNPNPSKLDPKLLGPWVVTKKTSERRFGLRHTRINMERDNVNPRHLRHAAEFTVPEDWKPTERDKEWMSRIPDAKVFLNTMALLPAGRPWRRYPWGKEEEDEDEPYDDEGDTEEQNQTTWAQKQNADLKTQAKDVVERVEASRRETDSELMHGVDVSQVSQVEAGSEDQLQQESEKLEHMCGKCTNSGASHHCLVCQKWYHHGCVPGQRAATDESGDDREVSHQATEATNWICASCLEWCMELADVKVDTVVVGNGTKQKVTLVIPRSDEHGYGGGDVPMYFTDDEWSVRRQEWGLTDRALRAKSRRFRND